MKIKDIKRSVKDNKYLVKWNDNSSYYPNNEAIFQTEPEAIDFENRLLRIKNSLK
jgi:hypothetical protein